MSNIMLAVTTDEMRAGDHVLHAILSSDNPQVQRLVSDTLTGLPAGTFAKFCGHVHASLLCGNVAHSMGCRCDSCMDDAFGPADSGPADAAEQTDARHSDLGVPTVDPRD